MSCPACGHQNPPSARFCNECAAPLGLSCTSCAAENPPGAKFCNQCAAPLGKPPPQAPERAPRDYTPRHLADKILQSKSALEGERKQVTVLFADVKGSMELAEGIDPEEWHRILDRFFQILAEGVHRFEGTINQYTGDGIMALFGAPIAHEDHAQRACYAALHLAEQLKTYSDELRLARGLNFSVRMGMNSGEVVVGKIGDDLRMDYTAQGQSVGLAARMEQIAEPSKAYLTQHTADLVKGYVALRDLGETPVKGIARPVRVYELGGAGPMRTRFELSRARGLSKFVGRADEMATLEAALERAGGGQAVVVGIVGEAGGGKSRLGFELLERCRARGIATAVGNAVAHGRGIPFLPLIDYLHDAFDLSERDDPERARRKIAGTVVLLEPELAEALPGLFRFLGVAEGGGAAASKGGGPADPRIVLVIQRLVQARCRRAPSVILFEDLHWFDPSSEEFLETLLDSISATPTLLLLTLRPEFRAAWLARPSYQELPLVPLGPEAIEEMLAHLLGRDASLAGLAERILERTAGNPFFIEEVVQSLVDTGVLEGSRGGYRLTQPVEVLEIPRTVQAVLAARIDRLPERQKRLLQTASVIGREFAQGLLAEVAGQVEAELAGTLQELASAELIYPVSLYPEIVYAFKHPLTQEVAYGSQLSEPRAELHAAAARALQEATPEKLEERAGLIAHHLEAAGEPLDAARWVRRAAVRAFASDWDASQLQWRKLRALVAPLPETRETRDLRLRAGRWMLGIGSLRGIPEEEAREIFEETRRDAQKSGNPRAHAMALSSYAHIRGNVLGDFRSMLELSREAVELARRCGDAVVLAVAETRLGLTFGHLGRFRDCIRVCRQALERLPSDLPLTPATYFISLHEQAAFGIMKESLVILGRLDEAAALGDAGLGAADVDGGPYRPAALHASAEFAAATGNWAEARRYAAASVKSAEAVGNFLGLTRSWVHLGYIELRQANWQEALASLKQAGALMKRTGMSPGWLQSECSAHLAELHLELGDGEQARAAADTAVAIARGGGFRGVEPLAHLARARVLRRLDGTNARAAIEEALAQAQAIAEDTEARIHEPSILCERAALPHLLGDEPARQRHLRAARDLWLAMGAPLRAQQIARELEAK